MPIEKIAHFPISPDQARASQFSHGNISKSFWILPLFPDPKQGKLVLNSNSSHFFLLS